MCVEDFREQDAEVKVKVKFNLEKLAKEENRRVMRGVF
jgi:hypothetical protein